MSFAAPFWLLLALVGLGVLYLHVRRRTTVELPSLFLWQRVASGRASKRPFKLPPLSAALWLQLAVVALLALALAEPMLGRHEAGHRILMVDATALPEAGEAARRELAANPPDAANVVSIVATGPAPRIVAARIADRGAAEAALGWIGRQDGGIDRARTDELVASLGREGETSAVGWMEGKRPLALNADVTRQGESWQAAGTLSVAEGDKPAALKVLFMAEGTPGFLDWMDVPLSFDGDKAAFSADLKLPGPGVVALRVPGTETGERFIVRSGAPEIKVLYLGEPTPAVVRALQAVPGTTLFQADALPATDATFDLVVVDNVAVPRRPASNVLWIGAGHVEGEPVPARIEASGATRWLATHPLSRGVDWTSLNNFAGFGRQLQPGGEVLLGVADQPLVEARTTRNGREVSIGLDLKATTWVDDPSYVALMRNVIGWAGLGAAEPCVTGAVCAVPARLLGGTMVRVPETVLARDEAAAQPVVPPAAFADADGWLAPGLDRAFVPERAGLYRITGADGRQALLAVNPAAEDPAQAGGEDVADAAPVSPGPALWWLLLVLGLVVMGGEFALARLGGEKLPFERGHPHWLQNRLVAAALGLAAVFTIMALSGVPLPQLSAGRDVVVAATAERAGELQGRLGEADIVSMGEGQRPGGDAGDALLRAAAGVPAGQNGRIVLDWNGNETRGNIAAALPVLSERGIGVDLLPMSPLEEGLSVETVSAPERVFEGDAFTLNAMVFSAAAQQQAIEIVRDGEVIATQDAQLAVGLNRVEALARADKDGFSLYAVRLAGSAEPTAQAGAWVKTVAAPKVAILAGQEQAAQGFAQALRLQGLDVTTVPAGRAPASLKAWLDYDAVVMMDEPAMGLATRQQQQLEEAVRDHGLELLILGGPNAFGPGGYYETPLEALSPLSSRVPRNAPKTGFVFVLDRSGSMQRDEGGADRLTIAKAATLNAAGLLNPKSQVGIVAFDSAAKVILPLQDAGNVDAIRNALGQLDADGGTSVYPALREAVNMLKGLDLPKRHIVVISDGLTQPGDFPALLAEAQDDGITVSAIAIGDAADPTSLANIAKLGGGAFHWSRDFHALPGILAQEALLSSTSPIKERTVTPQWVNRNDAFLKAAPETVPPITGYVDTTAKARAHLHLATSDEDGNVVPIMASWRYGAGQVLALATQVTGQWTAQWNQEADYPRFWAQIVRGLAPSPESQELDMSLERQGDEVIVSIAAQTLPSVAFAGPQTGNVRLSPVADGQWQGRFPVLADGDYAVTATLGDATAEGRVHVSFPAALSKIGDDEGKRESVARLTGGTMLGDTLGERPAASWTLASGWRLWALLAGLLFMASLALRYLPGLVGNRSQKQTQTITAPPLRRAA